MTFISQLNTTLDKYASLAENDFNSTEEQWQNHQIEFTVDSYSYGRKVYTINDVFYWLNYGTSVRHAKLSNDWSSKTKVKTLGNFGGSGRVLFVRKKYEGRGIAARQWDTLIQQKYMDEFAIEMQRMAEESVVI
jgi:hypothetical protein